MSPIFLALSAELLALPPPDVACSKYPLMARCKSYLYFLRNLAASVALNIS